MTSRFSAALARGTVLALFGGVKVRTGERGFSITEILMTLTIAGAVAAIVVPETSRTLKDMKLRGDARALHNIVGLAKMRAASQFTRVRVFVDLSSESFWMQQWDKTAATWVSEGATTTLADDVDFGFGGIAAPPPDTQPAINQADSCTDDDGDPIANSACIVFSSRGIPVDGNGSIVGDNALYVTDGTAVYGITISATPLVRLWWSNAASAGWVHR